MNIRFFLEITGMFLIPLLVVLIPIFMGQRYGIYRSKKTEDMQHTPVGTVVGSTFGLLAFMLAFTFQIVSNRYDTRKELLVAEVTNIRTAYLRAGLIPEPFRTETRNLLVEYVDLRIQVAGDPSKIGHLRTRSQQILDTFWSYSEKLGELDRSSENYSLFISSINDLVDNYNQRITMALEFRIPVVILWALFIITFFSMLALGYQFGISGKGSFRINLLLGVIFAVVMFLILALDRPETGLAQVNQKPMYTLQHQLQVMQKNVGTK
jgi:ABC-type multidrug transport system fused ATPase/permease subunit